MGSAILTKIRDVEIESFKHQIHYYWNESLTFSDINGNEVKIRQKDIYDFVGRVLSGYKSNIMSSIYGVGPYIGFKINLNFEIDSKGFVSLCRDIFKHPKDYYNIDKGESYNDFYEFLYITGGGYKDSCKFLEYLKRYKIQ